MNTPTPGENRPKSAQSKTAFTALRVVGHYPSAEAALSSLSLSEEQYFHVLKTNWDTRYPVVFTVPGVPNRRFAVAFIAKVNQWCALEGEENRLFDTGDKARSWARAHDKKSAWLILQSRNSGWLH